MPFLHKQVSKIHMTINWNLYLSHELFLIRLLLSVNLDLVIPLTTIRWLSCCLFFLNADLHFFPVPEEKLWSLNKQQFRFIIVYSLVFIILSQRHTFSNGIYHLVPLLTNKNAFASIAYSFKQQRPKDTIWIQRDCATACTVYCSKSLNITRIFIRSRTCHS